MIIPNILLYGKKNVSNHQPDFVPLVTLQQRSMCIKPPPFVDYVLFRANHGFSISLGMFPPRDCLRKNVYFNKTKGSNRDPLGHFCWSPVGCLMSWHPKNHPTSSWIPPGPILKGLMHYWCLFLREEWDDDLNIS